MIRFGGFTGNYYAQIVDKFLEPFDEIYRFANDMGVQDLYLQGNHGTHTCRFHKLKSIEEQKLNKDKKVNRQRYSIRVLLVHRT